MRINPNDYIGYEAFNGPQYSDFRHDTYQKYVKYIQTSAHQTGLKTIIYGIPDLFRTMLFTQSAIAVIDNLKISPQIDTARFGGSTKFYTLLLGQEEVVRIIRLHTQVFGIHLSPKDKDSYNVSLFYLNPTETLAFQVEADGVSEGAILAGKARERMMQCLLFLELTDPEILIVPAGKKHGTRANGYFNATDNDITIVDSTWNKFIVRTEGFGVTGHFRLQPHGEKSQLRKLIWVQPHQKHGYVRRPKSGNEL